MLLNMAPNPGDHAAVIGRSHLTVCCLVGLRGDLITIQRGAGQGADTQRP